jgi:hypothetical protein
MQRIILIIKWKLRVGSKIDAGLKNRLDVFFEEVAPTLFTFIVILMVFLSWSGGIKFLKILYETK